MYQRAEFEECEICESKPGSPTLCKSCIHNRSEIYKMNAYAKELEKKLSIIYLVVDDR